MSCPSILALLALSSSRCVTTASCSLAAGSTCGMDVQLTSSSDARRSFCVKLRFVRRARYDINNVGLIMFIIGSLTLSTWAAESGRARLSTLFTLFLTTITFKLVLTTMLPPVAYSTKMDKYIFGCLTFQVACVLLQSVREYLERKDISPDDLDDFDTWSFVVASCIWLLFNLFWLADAEYRIFAVPSTPRNRNRTRTSLPLHCTTAPSALHARTVDAPVPNVDPPRTPIRSTNSASMGPSTSSRESGFRPRARPLV